MRSRAALLETNTRINEFLWEDRKERREQAPVLQRYLLDADSGNQAQDVVVRYVINRPDVFLLKAFA